MNITFLLRLWPVYGGGETVTICLANEMIKRGWNVSVLYFKNNTRADLPFIDPAIKAVQIPDIRCDEFTTRFPDADKVIGYLKEYIQENDIHYLVNQWWPVEYIRGIRGRYKTKIITCLHQALYTPMIEGTGINGFLKKRCTSLYKFWKKRHSCRQVTKFLPHTDKYIFLSPAFQRQYEQFANYKNTNSQLGAIPNPLVYPNEMRPEDLQSKEKSVLLVGRMVEIQKRITRAIKIWRAIENDPRLDEWNFRIVGEGPDLAMYKQLAEALGLKRISFEGFRNPQPYYKQAAIFMMTSAFEGFPMTLVEAQQCGVVPVVMDSYLSLHDIVETGYNGIIVSNEDLTGYVNKIKELMTDTSLREKLAMNGLHSCRRFCVEEIVNNWEELFNDLSANRR